MLTAMRFNVEVFHDLTASEMMDLFTAGMCTNYE